MERILDGDSLPEHPENDLKNLQKDGTADAAWLVDTLVPTNQAVRRSRLESWLFAQRVFGAVPESGLPQVLVAMRGYSTFRTLVDTLERLGLTDPSLYAGAVRLAQQISAVGDRERAQTALALFQGGLVLIERARISRVLDVEAAGRLVASLVRVPLAADGEFMGGIAAWIDAEYLPAIGSAAGAGPRRSAQPSSMEADVLGAIRRPPCGQASPAGPAFEYEGVRYRLDPAQSEVARMPAVRLNRAGRRWTTSLASPRGPAAIAAGIGTPPSLPGRITALKSAAAPLLPDRPGLRPIGRLRTSPTRSTMRPTRSARSASRKTWTKPSALRPRSAAGPTCSSAAC